MGQLAMRNSPPFDRDCLPDHFAGQTGELLRVIWMAFLASLLRQYEQPSGAVSQLICIIHETVLDDLYLQIKASALRFVRRTPPVRLIAAGIRTFTMKGRTIAGLIPRRVPLYRRQAFQSPAYWRPSAPRVRFRWRAEPSDWSVPFGIYARSHRHHDAGQQGYVSDAWRLCRVRALDYPGAGSRRRSAREGGGQAARSTANSARTWGENPDRAKGGWASSVRRFF